MDTLLAEDLLLLFLDDESGATTGTVDLNLLLGGALLADLALARSIEVTEPGSVWRTARVRTTACTRPTDPLLLDALAVVAARERTAQDLVGRLARLGRGARREVTERLVARGVLECREDRVLGIFPRTRWPAADSRHEEQVRERLAAVLLDGADADPRTGALVALLAAVDRAHRVVDRRGRPAREVRRRAKEVGDGAWAAQAVRDAVNASTAAIVAATTAATVATTAGS